MNYDNAPALSLEYDCGQMIEPRADAEVDCRCRVVAVALFERQPPHCILAENSVTCWRSFSARKKTGVAIGLGEIYQCIWPCTILYQLIIGCRYEGPKLAKKNLDTMEQFQKA